MLASAQDIRDRSEFAPSSLVTQPSLSSLTSLITSSLPHLEPGLILLLLPSAALLCCAVPCSFFRFLAAGPLSVTDQVNSHPILELTALSEAHPARRNVPTYLDRLGRLERLTWAPLLCTVECLAPDHPWLPLQTLCNVNR